MHSSSTSVRDPTGTMVRVEPLAVCLDSETSRVDDRNDPRHCVRTLAWQLARRFPKVREELERMAGEGEGEGKDTGAHARSEDEGDNDMGAGEGSRQAAGVGGIARARAQANAEVVLAVQM